MASSQQSIYNTNSAQDETFNFNTTRVSPSILLIIVILAVIFFVSGLLHLLVRFLLRPSSGDLRRRRRRGRRDAGSDTDSVTALQGQLQQLFHLHDAGVDQSFIDALPVFHYKAIIGSKSPFDCAVCLCEFEPDDKLRLLPKCSHAFHTDCIDTWLLSHSTCPLCRASLLFPPPDCSPSPPPLNHDTATATNNNHNNNPVVICSPVVLVLESAGSLNASSREIEGAAESAAQDSDKEKERVVAVKLGKFRSVDNRGGGEEGTSTTSTSNNTVTVTVNDIGADSRRCFSMGSFAYVMDETSDLRVPIRTPLKKEKRRADKNPSAARMLQNPRGAVSECDCESKREFEFDEAAVVVPKPPETSEGESRGSVEQCHRRAFSFRFIGGGSGKFPRRTVSEIGMARWVRGERELGLGGESDRSVNSLDSQANQTSFARKTLLWLMGRQQNKVVHSSFDPPNNV